MSVILMFVIPAESGNPFAMTTSTLGSRQELDQHGHMLARTTSSLVVSGNSYVITESVVGTPGAELPACRIAFTSSTSGTRSSAIH